MVIWLARVGWPVVSMRMTKIFSVPVYIESQMWKNLEHVFADCMFPKNGMKEVLKSRQFQNGGPLKKSFFSLWGIYFLGLDNVL